MDRQAYFLDLLVQLRIQVPRECLAQLLWFLDEMLHWNQRLNLTAISDPKEALEKHLVDSLTLVSLLNGRERILDIGSGAGFPGIPLKLVFPGLELVSVDAVEKKIRFQRHIKRQLQIREFTPLAERVELLAKRPMMAKGFEVVVARAFASLGDLVRLAAPFLSSESRLIAMKGARAERELLDAQPVLRENRVECADIKHLQLPLSGAERTLLVFRRF